jgi:hypothetical protein
VKHRKPEEWLKIAAAKPKDNARPTLEHVHQGRMASDTCRAHLARKVPYAECECDAYPEAQLLALLDEASHQPTRVRVSAEHLAQLAAVAAKVTDAPYHRLSLEADGALIGTYHSDKIEGRCEIHAGDRWHIGPKRKGFSAALPATYAKEGPDITVHVNARYLLDALSVFEGEVTLVLGPTHILIANDDYAAVIAQLRSH